MFGRVAIITTDTNPSVYLEGKAGNGYQGDIAIDDIAFNYGDCPALCEYDNPIKDGWVNTVKPVYNDYPRET